MNDTIRYIIAGFLIFLIIVLQPIYLEWLGYDPSEASEISTIDEPNLNKQQLIKYDNVNLSEENKFIPNKKVLNNVNEQFLVVSTPLFTATLTNKSGGSFINYILTDSVFTGKKYIGGYNDTGQYDPKMPVSLILPSLSSCYPCLASYDERNNDYIYYNDPFTLINYNNVDTLFLNKDDEINLIYKLTNNSGDLITKSIRFSGNSYLSTHQYTINDKLNPFNDIELLWDGGLRPTESRPDEDLQYSSAIINQAGETENISISDSDQTIIREAYRGSTDWVAIRTKYFVSTMIPEASGTFATMFAKNNTDFGNRSITPAYSSSIGYPRQTTNIKSDVYLGPLDIDYISEINADLDAVMNWGYAIIRPISKGILWVLKFFHKTFNLNYGLVLLLFAVLIRLITGPLTKKSFESSQNMQKIQPELKKVQAKYKGDPQSLNRETMALYKKHQVNPLGGCLPILLQMPLLWALFIVFRSTIEFRGAPFIFWIKDLSQPDVIFNLPFTLPIYGSGVAILPLIMGATLILTMRLSTATMDNNQKPVMYFMNIFFVLLFNTFPSGLNLYYTTYNILSFFQQRKIRASTGIK